MNEWTSLQSLEARLGANWSAIWDCRARSESVCASLQESLGDLTDQHASVVVTGSLGRGEATPGSDADWILLIDGISDPDHAMLRRQVSEKIGLVIEREVGQTKTFGELVASHDLIHYIAGTDDTNINLTRRILLLSESRALTNPLLRERVIRNLLKRYVVYDRSVSSKSGEARLVPHFLLNDIVRYWRTIASDYASKMWERQGLGWGTRNVKLRFSRKLLFIWGLLASFSGELFESEALQSVEGEAESLHELTDHIRAQTDVAPLELLARAVSQHASDETASGIFTSYNSFLEMMGNEEMRKELETLAFDQAAENRTYDAFRELSGTFRKSVNSFFFDEHPKLAILIRAYGVF